MDPQLEHFATYFSSNKAEKLKECMVAQKRIACHLRLDPYTQNANECMNRVMKQKIGEKLKLDPFVEKMR